MFTRLLIMFFFILETLAIAQETLNFGVFKYRSIKTVQEHYKPLIDYLNERQNEYKIELRVLGREELENSIRQNKLDIISTNPSHYEVIRNDNLLTSVVATTLQSIDGITTDSLGGVIFTLSDNASIYSLEDLIGKSIGSLGKKSLGTYQAQQYEFMLQGIDISKHATLMEYKEQNEIVNGVLEGRVEAGFVRTGILESMINEGKLKKSQIRVINSQNMSYFPYMLSTRLYPEWPVVIMQNIDEGFSKKLAILLLSYGDYTKNRTSIGGFTLPKNYHSVTQLAKALSLPPYDKAESITFKQVYAQYGFQILMALFAVAIILIAFIVIIRLNSRIRSKEERFTLAIQGSRDGLYDWNMIDNTMFHSESFETMLGYDGNELPQTLKAWEDNVHPEDKEGVLKAIEEYIKSLGKDTWTVTFRMKCKDGSWRWIEGRGKAVFNSYGVPLRFVGFNTDITQKRENELSLEYAATHDMLTGLPNRTLLSNFMPQVLAGTKRHSTHAALLFVDLDGFKNVNDMHGHDIGDQLLKIVAIRMKLLLREEDIVARLGGDEFALLISNLNNRKEIDQLVSRLLTVISEPYLIENYELRVSASIGISFYPQNTEIDADTLLRQADMAMYEAKLNGKNRYYHFDEKMQNSKKVGKDRVEQIKMAISRDQLILHYQPKVDMHLGKIIGAEALVRWNDPENGVVFPEDFLPFVENSSTIYKLDKWVVNRVFEQISEWNKEKIEMNISINISAYTFKENELVNLMKSMFAIHPRVKPSQIELEILETSALHNIEEVQKTISSLHSMGIKVSLDDFGTGYSSLAYLKKLGVDSLKIDKSFVIDVFNDSGGLRILEATLGLADTFDCEAIAEGVESVEHGKLLIQFGCTVAQGYIITMPLLPETFMEWTKTWETYPSWKKVSPIAHKYFPLLYAVIEHRNWLKIFQSVNDATIDVSRQLDHRSCKFGNWLEAEGKELIANDEEYDELCKLHQKIHDIFSDMSPAKTEEERIKNKESIDQLCTLHFDLLEYLQKMIKKEEEEL